MMEEEKKQPDEVVGVHMEEHIFIRYTDTGEVLLDQRADIVHQRILGNDNVG